MYFQPINKLTFLTIRFYLDFIVIAELNNLKGFYQNSIQFIFLFLFLLCLNKSKV